MAFSLSRMYGKAKEIRRALGAPLAALMLCLSVAVPLLDMVDLRPGPVVESQHDPESCAPSHDHTVCTQAGANMALPVREGVRARIEAARVAVPLTNVHGVSTSVLADGHPTRAPPSA